MSSAVPRLVRLARPARLLRTSLPSTRTYGTTSPAPPPPRTIFSGIQPTGVPHLGNFFGALQQWVLQQNSVPADTRLIFSVVDLHAITQPQDAEMLRKNRVEMLATLLAIGIDPERSVLFEQSTVPEHAELMWVLSCGASTGGLSRMTQWKSKSGLDKSHEANVTDGGDSTAKLKLGLFSYPVLQAADILVHRATEVPVGEDQTQHLEFTRVLAKGFHHTYKTKVFPLPRTVLSPARRVMSLQDPTKKMSKSDPSPNSRIFLTDPEPTIRARIRSARTDSTPGITYDPINRPGVSNLIEIFGHASGRTDFDRIVEEEFKSCNMAEMKGKVADRLVEVLTPIRERYERIMTEGGEGYIEEVGRRGTEKARESAGETMRRVKEVMGLARAI